MRQSVDPSYDPAPYPPLGAISPLTCGSCGSGYVLQRDVPTCGMCGHMYRNGIWTREPEREKSTLPTPLPSDKPRFAAEPKPPNVGRFGHDFICLVCELPGKGVHNQRVHGACHAEHKRQYEADRTAKRNEKREAKARAEAKARQEVACDR